MVYVPENPANLTLSCFVPKYMLLMLFRVVRLFLYGDPYDFHPIAPCTLLGNSMDGTGQAILLWAKALAGRFVSI